MAAEKNKNKTEKKDKGFLKNEKNVNRLKTVGYLAVIFGVIAALILFATFVLDPITIYSNARKAEKEGQYAHALSLYQSLDGFMNADEKAGKIQGMLMEQAADSGDYQAAVVAAEQSGELERYKQERPEIFYEYGLSMMEQQPTTAKIYLSYVPDYPGAKEAYDEASLRCAATLAGSGRYSDAIQHFDDASSLDWFKTISPAQANEFAVDISAISYQRAHRILSVVADSSPASAQLLSQMDPYMQYCGEKTCISDTAEPSAVDFVNTFDFLVDDETEYLIVLSGSVEEVIDVQNSIFAKDTDGTYFANSFDVETQTNYLYRFSLLEDGTIMEKTEITMADNEPVEYTRLWS